MNLLDSMKQGFDFLFGTVEKNPQTPEVSIPLTKMPDEIHENIFRFVSGQIRLDTLPLVSKKFKILNEPFAKKCYPLSVLIPVIKKQMESHGKNEVWSSVYLLDLKQNQELTFSQLSLGNPDEKISEFSKPTLEAVIKSLKEDKEGLNSGKFGNLLQTCVHQKGHMKEAEPYRKHAQISGIYDCERLTLKHPLKYDVYLGHDHDFKTTLFFIREMGERFGFYTSYEVKQISSATLEEHQWIADRIVT